ncbi:hypothetical protein ILUMI_05588 [Ignelater luminosus]|uniref:Uncharacterized protein n=1 Tax=Ignelater luminosus TaxID=2038154 RepID=A0A8K0DCA4_IGNLU|nr:hypothetical protein ILUMI_05588 [Ignelater luminosus]
MTTNETKASVKINERLKSVQQIEELGKVIRYQKGETAEEKTEREKKLAQLEKKDRKCKLQIMGDSHLEYVKDKENSYELWSFLCSVFERKMPNEYEVVVTAFETLSKEDLTLNFVKNRLSEEELKRRSTGVTKNKGDSFNTMTFPSTKNFLKENWKNKNKNGTKSENSKKNVSNSGATEHLVCTKGLLSNVRKLKTLIRISVAKFGTHIEANKVGNFDIVSEVNGKLNHKEIEQENNEEVEDSQETEERIVGNIDLSEMCVKSGEDEVEEDIESRREYKVESTLKDEVKSNKEDEVVTFRRNKRKTEAKSEYDRKSTSGFLMKVFGNTVRWATKRQTSVALLSSESEYIAFAMAVSDLLCLKKLLEDFGISLSIPTFDPSSIKGEVCQIKFKAVLKIVENDDEGKVAVLIRNLYGSALSHDIPTLGEAEITVSYNNIIATLPKIVANISNPKISEGEIG